MDAISDSDDNLFEAKDTLTLNGGKKIKIAGSKPTISIWNYVGFGVGVLMLATLFAPAMLKGELQNLYYLGAAFWVGVITYCTLKIAGFK